MITPTHTYICFLKILLRFELKCKNTFCEEEKVEDSQLIYQYGIISLGMDVIRC